MVLLHNSNICISNIYIYIPSFLMLSFCKLFPYGTTYYTVLHHSLFNIIESYYVTITYHEYFYKVTILALRRMRKVDG